MRNLAVYVITLLFIFVLYSSLAYAKIYVGVDNAGEVISETFKSDLWWECLELLGVDFVSYHYAPKTNSVDAMRDVITFTKKAELHDVQIVLNLEAANWRASHIDSTGFDWTKWTDGTHRFRFRDDIIGMFVASPAFLGVIYDEAAHMQLTRNLKVPGNPPFLAETQGMDFEQAYDVVEKSASDMIDVYKQAGVEFVASEHVWPALFHMFARAGFTVAPKVLKEGWSPIMVAMAMGAAKQYGRELWITPDLWHLGVYPGHSAERLKSALVFSYWMGADRIYVENLNYNGSLVDTSTGKPILSTHGEVVSWFTKEFIPSNERNYTFRDVKPEIAIIRFDDTDFGLVGGQGGWSDRLFLYGASSLKPNDTTSNWLKIWSILTHGVVPTEGITWQAAHNPGSVYKYTPYSLFAPLNSVIVYDHLVTKEHLEGLKLAFLSGLKVSEQTLAALEVLVREQGLIVVSTPELAPDRINRGFRGDVLEYQEGMGKWVLTTDFLDSKVKEIVAPYLGKPDEIRYVFGDKEVIFKGEMYEDLLCIAINEI